MTVSAVTTQNATTASGAVAIVSASASTRVSTLDNPLVMEVISWSEYIAAFSACVMVTSFVWGIYASRKKTARDLEHTAEITRLAMAQEEKNKIERDKLQVQIDLMNK